MTSGQGLWNSQSTALMAIVSHRCRAIDIMGPCRFVIVGVFLVVLVSGCLATTNSCGPNERSRGNEECQRTCNACRDCGSCQCKSGYIRKAMGEGCITDAECHTLHSEWLHDAKHNDKKDKFFHCPQ